MHARYTVAATVLALTAGGCTPTGSGAGEGSGRARPALRLVEASMPAGLTAFAGCDAYLRYARDAAARDVGAFGLPFRLSAGPFAAALSPGEDVALSSRSTVQQPGGYSTTNVQEAGVDEPDTVKTDGRRVVTVRGHRLLVLHALPVPRLLGSVALPRAGASQLLLVGDRALVFWPNWGHATTWSGSSQLKSGPEGRPRTTVSVVDLADERAPRVVRSFHFDGDIVTARLVGGTARLVLRSSPQPRRPWAAPLDGGASALNEATERNQWIVRSSGLDAYLPSYSVESSSGRTSALEPIVACSAVSHPRQPSGAGLTSVLTIDPAADRPGTATAVAGSGATVYAGAERLYVTTAAGRHADARRLPVDSGQTQVHAFDISDPARARHIATGEVQGELLNQFSMSEHAGHLRVATTVDPAPDAATGSASESRITVLKRRGTHLVAVGTIGGLGRTERIYAVRFLGDLCYLVTFRQTDPLYVVDLRNPTRPIVRGELKIPGYSAYLHPLSGGRLLGVGRDATESGLTWGTAVSVFDVSDPDRPRRLAQRTVPQTVSGVEFDHHAFLYWAPSSLALVPVQGGYDVRGAPIDAVIAYRVAADGGLIELRRFAPPPRPPDASFFGVTAMRSLVVGDRLMTVSDAGVMSVDLATLRGQTWLAW